MVDAGDVLMSRAEFARVLGCNRSYITKLAKQGRLVLDENGMVWRDASHARIAETRDPAKAATAKRWENYRAESMEPQIDEDELPMLPLGDPARAPVYAEARARREHYAALAAQIQYERLAGRVCDVGEVERIGAALGTGLRVALESAADRLAIQLAAEADAERVRALLVEEVERVLGAFADELERSARKIAEVPS